MKCKKLAYIFNAVLDKILDKFFTFIILETSIIYR